MKIIFAPTGGFDGNEPNPHTVARLKITLQTAKENDYDFIITTGGVLKRARLYQPR